MSPEELETCAEPGDRSDSVAQVSRQALLKLDTTGHDTAGKVMLGPTVTSAILV